MNIGIRTLTLLLLVGCNGATSGTPPPVSSTTTSVEVRPRVDETYDWERYRGFSAFGLFAHDDSTAEETLRVAAASGWNTPRVCAETEWWEGDYYYPRVPRDLEALRENLDFLARIPDVQVLLIANCTYKHNAPDSEQLRWMNAVADVVSDYRNVALEVVNEYRHPLYNVGEATVIEAIRHAKGRVVEAGADDGVCRGDANLTHALRRFVTFASFHPCRTSGSGPWDPPRKFMEDLVAANGGMAVLSETVAFDDSGLECEDGLRTCDKERVQSYADRCFSVRGCKFNFHSMAGLRGADYAWFPVAR
jgi:hypothetical protein